MDNTSSTPSGGNPQQGQGAAPGIFFDSKGVQRDTATGEPVQPKTQEQRMNEAVATQEQMVAYFKQIGRFDLVAKIEGREYKPDFGTSAKHTSMKVKNALITLGYALLPGGLLLLVYEGVRLIIPRTRRWPSFIKYQATATETVVSTRVPRIPAR